MSLARREEYHLSTFIPTSGDCQTINVTHVLLSLLVTSRCGSYRRVIKPFISLLRVSCGEETVRAREREKERERETVSFAAFVDASTVYLADTLTRVTPPHGYNKTLVDILLLVPPYRVSPPLGHVSLRVSPYPLDRNRWLAKLLVFPTIAEKPARSHRAVSQASREQRLA